MSQSKPLFLPHENIMMKLRQLINDMNELEKEIYFLKNKNGTKPSEHLSKAKDSILLCIKVLQNA